MSKKVIDSTKSMLCSIMFDKDFFIETINEIEKQYNHDRKCSQAIKVIYPHDYITTYDNQFLYNQLIKILKIAMNDNHSDSWIDYYMWELDFGKKWETDSVEINGKNIKLKTADDLWDLLNIVTTDKNN
jgi:hypothetical protein